MSVNTAGFGIIFITLTDKLFYHCMGYCLFINKLDDYDRFMEIL